jgi:hypothetical protein
MKVIAFDAARKSTGYAYRNGVLWVTGTFGIHEYAKIIEVIRNACMDGCTHAAIEDPFGGPSISVLKALQDAFSRIAMHCEGAGLVWAPVRAITWQSACGITRKRGDTKTQAAAIARLIGAEPYLSADENDAVLLADFAERNAGVLEWHGLGGKVVK